jgi:nucleosome binding factor SPN SPT16 subunit
VELKLLAKSKAEDGSSQIAELMGAMKAQGGKAAGALVKEKPDGKICALWGAALADSGFQTVDVSGGISDVLSNKDEAEVKNVKRACYLLVNAMKSFVVPELEDIIDQEKKVKHTVLSEKTEKVLLNPEKLNIKLKADNIDVAYLPVFQSGGKYDLKLTAQCEDTTLHYGVICTSVGARYSSYCANVARTYMVDPSKEQEEEVREPRPF